MKSLYLLYAIALMLLLAIFAVLPFTAYSHQLALASELHQIHQKGEDTAKVYEQLLNEDWQ